MARASGIEKDISSVAKADAVLVMLEKGVYGTPAL